MGINYILGISCYYHDSAAVLIKDGDILGAVQEERFTRIKHDAEFPINSIKYLLKSFQVGLDDITAIVYYEKPLITFERLIETHLNHAPFGFINFATSILVWIRKKLFLSRDIHQQLRKIHKGNLPPLKFSEHHLSHAASAFFPSPFEDAAVLCVDGVGEWATTSAWVGDSNKMTPLWEIHFPHSLGLLYSTITSYLGFKVNSGEYKVMGLAPYGNANYVQLMLDNLITLHEDGSYSLNMEYFDYGHKLSMSGSKLEGLFGRKSRNPESNLDSFHMDVAASLQVVLEQALLHITTRLHKETGKKRLCLAGGVALNCVANSKILESSGFDKVWIQPASGDAGGALGAALSYWHLELNGSRQTTLIDSQKGSYLGPEYSDDEIEAFLKEEKVPYEKLSFENMVEKTSLFLEDKKIVGWFQGRLEYGPRALGARSILGDARVSDLQKTMNLKIKFRESFRPFAPVILEEDSPDIFNFKQASPYMLFVANIRKEHRKPLTVDEECYFGLDKLNLVRSIYPAITHVDYSARLQTVSKMRCPHLYSLLETFKKRTGCSVLVNTSFNVRGEPIVCTPPDAYRCFRRTDIDVLVMGNIIVTKQGLPDFIDHDWSKQFELD